MKRLIVLLVFVLAACAPKTASPELLQNNTNVNPSYPTAQAEVASPNQNVSGIDVRMDRVSLDGKNVNANVCFTQPDASDWSIWKASLNYGGIVLEEYGTTLASFQDAANGQPAIRCDTLTFVIAPDADLSNMSIVIDAIAAAPREGDYCSFYMPKIQQAMLERGTGITLDCIDSNMQITGKPPEMTQEQAEQIVFSDEFYTIQGPWTFAFSLTQ